MPTDFLPKYQVELPTSIALSLSTSTSSSPLPVVGYTPDEEYDVFCGRGKGSYNKPDNKRFRAIVRECLNDYVAAKTKVDKGAILNMILDRVKSSQGGRQVRFVVLKDGAWHEISEDQSREKIGQCIRELLAAPENGMEQLLFDVKHSDLLSLQREIFQQLLKGSSSTKKGAKSQFQQARAKVARAA